MNERYITDKAIILNTPITNNRSAKYGRIHHSVFLEEIPQQLAQHGYIIKEERLMTANKCSILSGSYMIQSDVDIEMCPSISFVNSYDGSKKALIQASSTVLVCKNGMLRSGFKGSRKHIGDNATSDFRIMLQNAIGGLKSEFEQLVRNKEEMKCIELDKMTISNMIGDLYLNQGIITETQLSVFKHERKHSKDFQGNSLWSVYNNMTEAFKTLHPSNYTKTHALFHTYILDSFQLSNAPRLFEQLELTFTNPE